MDIKVSKPVNARTLAWAIRKATGLNLGGFVEVRGVPQTGSLTYSESGGLKVTLPDSTPAAVLLQGQALVDAHDATLPPPLDFPPAPPPVAKVDEKVLFAAATATEKLEMLARKVGLA